MKGRLLSGNVQDLTSQPSKRSKRRSSTPPRLARAAPSQKSLNQNPQKKPLQIRLGNRLIIGRSYDTRKSKDSNKNFSLRLIKEHSPSGIQESVEQTKSIQPIQAKDQGLRDIQKAFEAKRNIEKFADRFMNRKMATTAKMNKKPSKRSSHLEKTSSLMSYYSQSQLKTPASKGSRTSNSRKSKKANNRSEKVLSHPIREYGTFCIEGPEQN